MAAPPSSRSVDPRLAAASGVMRDTLGAIHNLQHLLGSVRVGPKGLSRVIPDVHASCAPMIGAAHELVAGVSARLPSVESAVALGELVIRRMQELEASLDHAKKSAFRASDRLHLETDIAGAVRDLDGALELVELLVEASASGSVPVDVTDVIRETAVRADAGSGRRRIQVAFLNPAEPIAVRVNPRLALRLVALGVALSATRDGGVHVGIEPGGIACRLALAATPLETNGISSHGIVVSMPPLIDLTERCAADVARASGASFERGPRDRTAIVTFPSAASD
jgi:hypothetical protein